MSYSHNQQQFENLDNSCSKILYKKISSDTLTPVLAFLKISQYFNDHHFLFESAENSNNKGRFAIIGFMPDMVWKCIKQQSFLSSDFKNDKDNFVKQNGDPLQNLRKFIKSCSIDFTKIPYEKGPLPSMCSGIFGYMGYDMIRLIEKIPDNNLDDEINIPDSIFIRPQIVIVFDNLYDLALICAPSYNQEKYQELTEKINNVEKILSDNYQDLERSKITITTNNYQNNFNSNYNKEEYCSLVNKAKEYITNGDIFQVLPSQRFSANFPQNSSEFTFYRFLRNINPSPFLFYLKFDDFVLTGASPEIMVSLQNKKITIRPLAGTRKRGKNIEEDKKIAEELLSDEKEIAEHLMLIDLARHDIGSISEPGSIAVTKKMIIENYSHVMHISSNVEGKINDKFDALDALIFSFPAGTVSGAPKIRAMEIIEELEKTKRSFYAGCAGYFSSNGDMETCIIVRSAVIKNNKIYTQAGAGVVYDSVPEFEYQECLNKAQALFTAFAKTNPIYNNS